MDSQVNYIRQRLSLREPLARALDLASRLIDKLTLQKPPQEEAVLSDFLKKEVAEIKSIVPTFKDFDRDFPSLAFSIATGIGKTRLMGAIITYLYLKKGIKHFFVLAPNLTLYNKLIRDFGDPTYEKYVFKGLSEFVSAPPTVITGEDYQKGPQIQYRGIQINIFNISKFNKDSKAGTKGTPKMRRLSEYIGQSYFDYLAGLPDLVILMDEAHRYHADASKKAINELRPILGFEMTATPLDEKGKAFKNIVFEYNLVQALADKRYVKDPTVAGRKNFKKTNYSPDEIEIMKLEDGISVHERTKLAIELYARQTGEHVVHPFILVVCRDIAHARAVKELLESDRIFQGHYKDKVLQIDSSTKKDEEIEQQFVALESPDNTIEIVVHVNMLKEGWDVNNLYTIIPLRAADAAVLIEQTIGRGLRLPYGGERTGNHDVDKLTVIAHDNFAAVIDKAQNGDGVLSKLSYVELDDDDVTPRSGTVISTPTSVEKKYEAAVKQAQTDYEKKIAERTCDVVRAVLEVIPQAAQTVQHYEDLKNPEVLKIIRQKAFEVIEKHVKVANPLFAEQEAKEQLEQLDKIIKQVVVDYEKNVIEIPRLVIEQPRIKAEFEDFDLDTSTGYALDKVSVEIQRQSLSTGETDIIVGRSGSSKGNPLDILVSRLIDFDDIDYDEYCDLLYKLAGQAVKAIDNHNPGASTDDIAEIVNAYKERLALNIYGQMKSSHFHIKREEVAPTRVIPFSRILDQHLVDNGFAKRMIGDVPEKKSWVNKYIVRGLLKSYYPETRFDSSTEWDFAYILENDPKVLKWLRPVPQQFNIYWANGSKRYEPDFIVETEGAIYMCETKAEKDVDDKDVQDKAQAARHYCSIAGEYAVKHGGKPWHYVIIPHTTVDRLSDFKNVINTSQLF